MKTKVLFEFGIIGYYTNCEVIQIVLQNKTTRECWNYFTHISLSKDYVKPTERVWLTKKPISINTTFKIMISKQIIPVAEIISILDHAIETQEWKYGEDLAKLDDVFEVDSRFVPEIDPTGNKLLDSILVPLELSFYGSTFSGNYYIVELFSAKRYLNTVLTEKDKAKIQVEIKKTKIQFDLQSLSDRIGNVFCKMQSEIIKHKSTKLSPERGVAGKFERTKMTERDINCFLTILSTDDRMVINNQVLPFKLSETTPVYEYEMTPNRYHNYVSVVDQETGVIYYSSEHDYSFGSDYYSVIKAPKYFVQPPLYRKIDGYEKIETINLSGVGEVRIEKEIHEIVQRQNKWKDRSIQESSFFRAFEKGDKQVALDAIKDILNDKQLLWDLKEIWLIDPYLSADDILSTVVFCKKRGIIIKCLTDIGTINNNVETRLEKDAFSNRFYSVKQSYATKLRAAIPENTDIRIEFRTVRDARGKRFHDRYLILRYGINKCRAWSLGISVNSIGASHHIIQIVENPQSVAAVFEEIWDDVDYEECKIYSNL